MDWTRFTPEEIERRRLESVEALKGRERAEFDRWYQERCDRDYWKYGQRCAGCDHWNSRMGRSGECTAAGLVSGAEVLASVGIRSCSWMPEPGFPITSDDFHCGKFRDDFDWSTLDPEYLERIGAMKFGKLKPKPKPPASGRAPHP